MTTRDTRDERLSDEAVAEIEDWAAPISNPEQAPAAWLAHEAEVWYFVGKLLADRRALKAENKALRTHYDGCIWRDRAEKAEKALASRLRYFLRAIEETPETGGAEK